MISTAIDALFLIVGVVFLYQGFNSSYTIEDENGFTEKHANTNYKMLTIGTVLISISCVL